MCNRQNNFIQVLRSYVHEASLVDQHFMLCFLVEERFKQTSTLCMLVKILKIMDDSLPTGYSYIYKVHSHSMFQNTEDMQTNHTTRGKLQFLVEGWLLQSDSS